MSRVALQLPAEAKSGATKTISLEQSGANASEEEKCTVTVTYLAAVDCENHVTYADETIPLGGAPADNGLDIYAAVSLLLEENAHTCLYCSRVCVRAP